MLALWDNADFFMMCADQSCCLSKGCLNMFQLLIYSLLNFSMSFRLWVVKMCSCTHFCFRVGACSCVAMQCPWCEGLRDYHLTVDILSFMPVKLLVFSLCFDLRFDLQIRFTVEVSTWILPYGLFKFLICIQICFLLMFLVCSFVVISASTFAYV